MGDDRARRDMAGRLVLTPAPGARLVTRAVTGLLGLVAIRHLTFRAQVDAEGLEVTGWLTRRRGFLSRLSLA